MRTYPGRAVTLLYLYWEPVNAADYVRFEEHRRDVSAFAERVAAPPLAFESMAYGDLWASWDARAAVAERTLARASRSLPRRGVRCPCGAGGTHEFRGIGVMALPAARA